MELPLNSRLLNSGLIWGVAALSSIALSGCKTSALNLSASETLHKGYVIDEQQLELVPVGSSREQVILALGSPSTKATFDNEVYYYISQTRKRSMAFQNPHIVDQRVLAVYFGEDGRVTNIANYGLKDGKVFDFVSRTTPTGGKDQTFIGQILAGVSGLPSVPGGSGQPTR
jgi:outer membrane protein assembly factor BamE (lipoprotein component of BamABCDE complex)